MQKGIIICDECGVQIEKEQMEIWDRVIAIDEDGCDVVEQYFDCPHCGKHYTVTVIDRQQKIIIQKRRQVQKKINLCIKNYGANARIRKYQEEERELHEEFKYRAKVLKERYEKEIQA